MSHMSASGPTGPAPVVVHVIEDDECLALLERAVEYLPPRVRFVVGTRRDPPLSLARLRAHGPVFARPGCVPSTAGDDSVNSRCANFTN